MTKLGWPVAHPKFINLPSAKIRTPFPHENYHLATMSLITYFYTPGIF